MEVKGIIWGESHFTKDRTTEEKRKANRELMARSRGQVKVPEAAGVTKSTL